MVYFFLFLHYERGHIYIPHIFVLICFFKELVNLQVPQNLKEKVEGKCLYIRINITRVVMDSWLLLKLTPDHIIYFSFFKSFHTL